MQKAKKIHVLAAAGKPQVKAALQKFLPWLRQRAEVQADTEIGKVNISDMEQKPDLAVVFGGDGSMLVAARHFASHNIPVLGVNLGKFGFLTQTTGNEAFNVLERVLKGECGTEERMMMKCRLQRGEEIVEETVGLNDAVISRTALSRLLTIDLFVDGKWVNTYRSDGLIVATPVGSTAHSLAASGPILTPDLRAFIICPICPHTLSNRPIVMSDTTRIELHPRDYSEQPALTVDGQVYRPLKTDDTVTITKSDYPLKLIKVGDGSFFETLREKLGWSGQPNYVDKKRETN